MAPRQQLETIMIEDATLIFKNFSGREGPFNQEGDKDFGVLLEPDDAEHLAKLGWNVKYLKVREEGEEPQAWLPVGLKYRARMGGTVRPPITVLIGSKGRTTLDEDTVEIIDQVDIETVDVEIRPYQYDFNGRQGVKAYLQAIFVKVRESYLQLKYADVLEVGSQPALESGGEEIWDADVISEQDDEQLAIEAGEENGGN